MDWTKEENVTELKKLWAAGLSASDIGDRMGASRNSILGKAHRLRLTDRSTTQRVDAKRVKRVGRLSKTPRPLIYGRTPQGFSLTPTEGEPLPPPQETDIPRKPLELLEDNECRWPTREINGRHHFCAAPKLSPWHSYCAAHTKRSVNEVVAYRVPPRPMAAKIPTFADAEAD